MLKDTFVPLELPSRGKEFSETEIELIKNEGLAHQIILKPREFYLWIGSLELYVFGAELHPDNSMKITNFSVGLKELGGHGLGTQILKRGLVIGRRLNTDLESVCTDIEHVSVLNAIAKVLGPENVTAETLGGEGYGRGYENSLEELITPDITRVKSIQGIITPEANF